MDSFLQALLSAAPTSAKKGADLLGYQGLLSDSEKKDANAEKELFKKRFNDAFYKLVKKPAGVFYETLDSGAEKALNALGQETPESSNINQLLTEQDTQNFNEHPVREISKAVGTAASYAVPFGGFKSAMFASNPLVNQTLRYAVPGFIEGSTQGYGQSDPGNELRDTAIGAGIGVGSELLGGLITNPQYRNMLSDYLQEGYNGPSNYYSGSLNLNGQDIYKNIDIPQEAYNTADEVSKRWGDMGDKDITTMLEKFSQGGDKALNAEAEWIGQRWNQLDQDTKIAAWQRLQEIINTMQDTGQISQVEFLRKHLTPPESIIQFRNSPVRGTTESTYRQILNEKPSPVATMGNQMYFDQSGLPIKGGSANQDDILQELLDTYKNRGVIK